MCNCSRFRPLNPETESTPDVPVVDMMAAVKAALAPQPIPPRPEEQGTVSHADALQSAALMVAPTGEPWHHDRLRRYVNQQRAREQAQAFRIRQLREEYADVESRWRSAELAALKQPKEPDQCHAYLCTSGAAFGSQWRCQLREGHDGLHRFVDGATGDWIAAPPGEKKQPAPAPVDGTGNRERACANVDCRVQRGFLTHESVCDRVTGQLDAAEQRGRASRDGVAPTLAGNAGLIVVAAEALRIAEGRGKWSTDNLPGRDATRVLAILNALDRALASDAGKDGGR
jgi:hypothetical protein